VGGLKRKEEVPPRQRKKGGSHREKVKTTTVLDKGRLVKKGKISGGREDSASRRADHPQFIGTENGDTDLNGVQSKTGEAIEKGLE